MEMKTILKTNTIGTVPIDTIDNGSWVILTNPKNEEISSVAEECNIDLKDMRSALDREEISRIEVEDDYTLVVVDIPSITLRNKKAIYTTIPLSIIYSEDRVVTVCLEDSPIINRVKNLNTLCTYKKTQLIYRILLSNAKLYMEYLMKVNSMRAAIEGKVSTKETLAELYELEKCLVFFKTSLRSNEMVLSRLSKLKSIRRYEEDEELFEDVLIEYKQAYEMTQIYYDILDNTISKNSALMDFELNNAMKLLTSLTIVMAIPTVISGFFGMNMAKIPFNGVVMGFWYVFVITIVICIIILLLLKKMKML